jgi:hypothetical protein
VRTRPARITVQGPSDHPTSISIFTNPLATGEQPVLFSDGWVGVARLDPYRVDWFGPSGKPIHGAPLPFDRIEVNDAEKRAVLQRQADQQGREPRDPATVSDWPEVLPPFLANALVPARDGRLWIRRAPSMSHPETRYDVVDRRGALVGRVTLPATAKIVGLGNRTVYTSLTDDDGIQRLRRHAMPRF